MEELKITASVRDGKGKNFCKSLRKQGQIPGVVYKGGKDTLAVYVDKKQLWHALHTTAGENAIITLNFAKDKEKDQKTVIVKEIQLDPVKELFLHVDFYEISLTEKVRVKVPVTVKGEAPGVKEDGGVLSQTMWELEVECMAKDIPDHIDVFVDMLKMNDAIHIKEVKIPEGVVLIGDPEQVVVGVNPPQAEEEITAEVPAAGEVAEEPEVIKKGKKEEEVIEGEEAAEAPAKPPKEGPAPKAKE